MKKTSFNRVENCDTKSLEFLQWILGLYKLGQNTEFQVEKSEIFQSILVYIVNGFDADTGSLAFLTEDDSELHLIAGIDLPEGVVGSKVPVSESRMGAIIRANEPSLFNDIDNNKSSRVTSAMCWPLNGHEKTLGALNINRGRGATPYNNEDLEKGKILIGLISVVLENAQLHKDYQVKIQQLEQMNLEIKSINTELHSAKSQLLQSEKLASIGQLAAGVAHEINNPVGFIHSNMSSLAHYHDDLFQLLDAYEVLEKSENTEDDLQAIAEMKTRIDMNYLRNDVKELMAESNDGVVRVKQIVQDLKDFSHVDGADWQWVDIHKGLDSTLNMARNEVKYKADVIKEYGKLPDIECMPSQINQVFMNLIVNAAQAIETRGVIKINSGVDGPRVWVSISDTGKGISDVDVKRIFEPFFTTKAVGKGTGLGLSLSYGIVEKHSGKIEVESEPGKGTVFTVYLPIKQQSHDALSNTA